MIANESDISDYQYAYDHCENTINKLVTSESITYSKQYKPRKDDIFVITPPKAGTIWTGYIIFLLKCKCDQSIIDQISENEDFMPHMPACYDYNFLINNDDWKHDPDVPPRLLMKHTPLEESYVNLSDKDDDAVNGRVIAVMRDPRDAIYSWYRMHDTDVNNKLNFDAFYDTLGFRYETNRLALDPLSFFKSWGKLYFENGFNYRHNNLLTLFFDDLIENRLACIQEIEKFLNINNPQNINNSNDGGYDKELENEIYRLTSFEEMRKVDDKLRFGRIGRYYAKREFGLTDEQVKQMVFNKSHLRSDGGKTGQGKEKMPQKWIDECDRYWKENVEPIVACQNYQQFRQKVSFLYQK